MTSPNRHLELDPDEFRVLERLVDDAYSGPSHLSALERLRFKVADAR